MSLLFPLFLAGIAAVALPVVFHLIRRTPSGRTPFSSLMFLRTSPPRLSRRKRLDQVVLLSLRALALALLALAFARPYLRAEAQVSVDSALGPRIALLVDTSASMRRTGLWSAARAEVDAVIAESPADALLSLTTFDRALDSRVTFEESLGLGTGPARTLVRERLAALTPSWAATDLGGALMTLVDDLDGSATEGRATVVVLVSDVQEGSDLAALEAYDWPEGIQLEVRSVRSSGGNASLHPVPRSTGRGDDAFWVRVTSSADSVNERFQLRWASATGEGAGEERTIACPPGESSVVRAPTRPSGAHIDRLVLAGDSSAFDDVLFDLEPVLEPVVVPAYGVAGVTGVAGVAEGGERGLAFFLERVFEGTDGAITLEPRDEGGAIAFDVNANPLVLLALGEDTPPSDATLEACLRHAAKGGVVLAVLGMPADGADFAEARRVLRTLLDRPDIDLSEATTGKGRFALLGEIDFAHELFAPFSDPRFSDFTKIRFWHHRILQLASEDDVSTSPSVVARFDDGAPFLLERAVGLGRIFVMASGWDAEDSDFALSSKFAPLLLGILRLGSAPDLGSATFHVGDRIPLPRTTGQGARTVRRPDGEVAALATDAEGFTETDLPGHYELEDAGRRTPFTVRLDPGESRVDPLEAGRLARLGVPVVTARASQPEQTRQEQSAELEQRQKLWRYLIVLALGVLMVETAWAGRLARRSATPVS